MEKSLKEGQTSFRACRSLNEAEVPKEATDCTVNVYGTRIYLRSKGSGAQSTCLACSCILERPSQNVGWYLPRTGGQTRTVVTLVLCRLKAGGGFRLGRRVAVPVQS